MRTIWKRLLEQRRVERHATSTHEIRGLRAVVKLDLQDAALAELPEDNTFGLAFEAGSLLAGMATAGAGYHVRVVGTHQTAFAASEIPLGSPASPAEAYLEVGRRRRDRLRSDNADVTSATEVAEILRQIRSTLPVWSRRR